MTPRKIEICFIATEDKLYRLLTLRTNDIIAVSVVEQKDNEQTFEMNLLTSSEYKSKYSINDPGTFSTRLAYAAAADRASDDPVAFPSAALAAAKAGVHSMGMSFYEVDALVKSIVTETHYKYALLYANKAQTHPAPLVEFIKRSGVPALTLQATEPAQAPSIASTQGQQASDLPAAVDVAERVRSRTAYPANSAHAASSQDHPPAP